MRSIARTPGYEGKRMLTEQEGMQYAGMGRNSFRQWAQNIGARRTFGRSVRYDRQTIDAEFDRLAAEDKDHAQGED